MVERRLVSVDHPWTATRLIHHRSALYLCETTAPCSLEVQMASLVCGRPGIGTAPREAAAGARGVLRRLRRRSISAYVGCEAGSVQLATFGGSEPCAALGAHRGRVTCLAAHPASRKGAAASSDTLGLRRHLLASASVDWTCRLRVGSTPLGAPLDHGAHGYVASIAWSPSRAALLCTAASDGCVRLWTAASGQIIGAGATRRRAR